MAQIPIYSRQKLVAHVTVDDQFEEVLKEFKWYVAKLAGNDYIVSTQYGENIPRYKRPHDGYMCKWPTMVFMHRVIWELSGNILPYSNNKERLCFKDNNRFNITLDNLTVMSYSDSVRLAKANKVNKKTKYKGVEYHKNKHAFIAHVKAYGESHYAGQSKNVHEAARMYNNKAKEILGSKAILNIIRYEK